VAFGDGMPASADWVRKGILEKYEKNSKTTPKIQKPAKKVIAKKAAPANKGVSKKASVKKVVTSPSKAKKTGSGKTVKKAVRK
jgi:hypothetical protein